MGPNSSPSGSADPIAIVGMSCRLPGAATSPEGLWHMLSNGMSGWSREAGARFNMASFYHPSPEISGAFNTRGLYLLKQDVSQFDHQFFNISPIEAKSIDPQQRLMLELAYEAFDNAGIPAESLSSSDTGVYCAVSNHDYETMQSRDPESSPSYRFTGTGTALLANRISYFFNLYGPSITLDTACSGSLVAVHEACKAIRAGEVKQALVGSTNLILDPERVSVMASFQVLSDHGRCYTFDSRASGFARGEGVAALILKPLSKALRDGDPIRAVIRGTSVNSDGRTPGVTMPSQAAQVAMIRKAYDEAMLDPSETCYVEAHGTGTKVGDKIESAAIAEIFSQDRPVDLPVYVGSVKTNIGHTESTAGLAGLLKMVLMLERGMIPPNLNFSRASDAIPLKDWHMSVPQRLQPWPTESIRRGSVNSFGYGGTNAHGIIDAYQPDSTSSLLGSDGYSSKSQLHGTNGDVLNRATNGESTNGNTALNEPINGDSALNLNGSAYGDSPHRRLFVLSHDNEQGVSRSASDLKRYVQQLQRKDSNVLDDLCYTLSMRRSRFPHRVAVSACDQEDLLNALDEVSRGLIRPQSAIDGPRTCFAFTGQGAQWAGMGQELLHTYPAFARAIAEADVYLKHLGADWSLATELCRSPDESRINEASISQPCCTAIQIALVDLLRTWNIRPRAVCGHSSGEIAAAYAAGFIAAEDALAISFYRGRCVANLKRLHPELDGAMLAAGLSPSQASEYISKAMSQSSTGKIVVACINSPSSVTLSGDRNAIKAVQALLEADGIFNRLLVVDVAYHSHHMELARDEYLTAMSGLRPLPSDSGISMVSSVSGKEIQYELLDETYWVRNMVSPVRFSEALQGALRMSSATAAGRPFADIILEVGPHSALAGPIKQILKANVQDALKVSYSSVLSRNRDAVRSTLQTVGDLFAHGVQVDFDAINDPNGVTAKRVLTNLPTYSWQHTMSHWHEGRVSAQYRARRFAKHDLLGVPGHDSLSVEPTWKTYLRLSDMPWLKGHVVNDQVIFPAAGHISMALEALRQTVMGQGRMWKDLVCRFRNVVVESALLIPDSTSGVETFFTLRRYSSSARETSSTWKEFRIFTISDKAEATEHCRGLACVEYLNDLDEVGGGRENLQEVEILRRRFEGARRDCRKSLPPTRFYDDLRSVGIDYTGAFASFTEVHSQPLSSVCALNIPDTKALMPAEYQQPHFLHPATLDTCFQAVFPALMSAGMMNSSYVLTSIEDMQFSSDLGSAPGTRLLACATVEPFGRTKQRAEITVGDSALAQPSLIKIKGLEFTSMGVFSSVVEGANEESLCHVIEWSLDTSIAKAQDIYDICHVGLPETSVVDRREAYDRYGQSIIQKVISTITPEQELSMLPHHRQLLKWIRARKPETVVEADLALREQVISFGIDGKTLVHVGDHLAEILKGEVDPLTVLTKDDLLYQLYSAEEIERCHLQLANYVRRLQFKNPHMRILEIGGGTASTTLPILNALTTDRHGCRRTTDKLEQYVFTDISSGFFEKAKARLEAFGELVQYKKLDIEKPVSKQGFEEGSFDLVLASNVLHATQSISTTLQNVRKLLKVGGKLGLVEITEPGMTWPMIVGTLPGWWLGAEDGRVDSPLLNVPRWDGALRRTGFGGVDAALKDYEPDYEHQVSLIISTATSEEKGIELPPIHVLVHDEGRDVAEAFQDLITTSNEGQEIQQKCIHAPILSDAIYVILLELVEPFLTSCTKSEFLKLKDVLSQARGVLWVTRGSAIESESPEKAAITGLSRTLRSEDLTSNVFTLDLDPSNDSPLDMAQQIQDVVNQAFGPDAGVSLPEFEYAVRGGKILVPRIRRDDSLEAYVRGSNGEQQQQFAPLLQSSRALGLEIETPGLLESFYWADSKPHSRPPRPNEVRIKLGMVALNFKDLMNAMGQLEGLSAMLIECSGTVVEAGEEARGHFSIGDRVCALGYDGLATTSNLESHLVQRIPDDMSFELASSILVSYATALYALKDVAHLEKGESILIHSGAGALGQAAIGLARYLGAGDIFVTVGNAEKKKLIMQQFDIPEEHIYSSRSLSFGPGIRRQTHGKGVDVVLNSLSGDAARESQMCLAQFGRFVEVGKKDLLSNARMETQYLEKNSIFAAVDLTMVAKYKPLQMQALLGTVIHILHTRAVRALSPINVIPITGLEDAFRLMQTGKHMGKIVLQLDEQAQVRVQQMKPNPPTLGDDSTYLVVGGLGGLGRAIIRHLVQLGAKHIATLSRSGADTPAKEAFVKEMSDGGVDLVVYQGSVANVEDIRTVKEAAIQFPVRGVVQGAMTLQDSTVGSMTYDQWRTSLRPKITGTLNLDEVFGDALNFFILLSSGCGVIGSKGQGSYAAGSTFQDAFARHRASRGLPVRTIDLGVVESAGYTAENESAAAHALQQGVKILPLKYVLALLNDAISHPMPAHFSEAQVLIGLRRADPSSTAEQVADQRPDPKFSHMWTAPSYQNTAKVSSGHLDIRTALRDATTPQLAIDAVQAAMTTKLSRLLAMPAEEFNPERPVASYGTDSLIAVELRNWVSKQLEAHVQIFELMSPLPIRGLAGLIAGRSRLVHVMDLSAAA